MTTDLIKIQFRFVPREGWLPHDQEGLWARRLTEDTAQVRSVPFLQDGVAINDVVRFRTDAEGMNWSIGRCEAAGRCVVRVLPIPAGPLGRSAHAVQAEFGRFGLGGESFSAEFPLVALDVPADADFRGIKQLLEAGREQGWWGMRGGSVGGQDAGYLEDAEDRAVRAGQPERHAGRSGRL